MHHWLALSLVNTNWANTTNYLTNLLAQRGYPLVQFSSVVRYPNLPSWFDEGDMNTFAFQHVWVKLTVGTTNYVLDPSFKISEPVTSIINLSTATGFSSNTVMSITGGTDTTNYAQNIDEGILRSQLQGYNSNLLTSLQNNYPNASVRQILGGQQITPWNGPLSQTNLFLLDTRMGLYPLLTWSNVPVNFYSQFGLQLGTLDNTFVTNWAYAYLKGGRLSITTSNDSLANLWLDDALIATITNKYKALSFLIEVVARQPCWSWDTNVNVPRDTSSVDRDGNFVGGMDRYKDTYGLWTNASYNLTYAFEPDVKWLNERSQQLAVYRQQGLADMSRQVVTESLNILGLSWMIQTKLTDDIIDQQLNILPEYLERFGLIGQENGAGYFVNFFLQYNRSYPNSGANTADLNNNNRAFDLASYFASSFEHGVIEQFQTNTLVGASTVKVLQLANTNHQPIYLANTYTWGFVQPKLTNYNAAAVNNISYDV